jgi:formate/nitrite transporter FocA (FNT family)
VEDGNNQAEEQKDAPDEEGELTQVFDRTVEEGSRRLERTWPGLLATGAVGGIDVSIGVFALLLVEHETGNKLLSALAFGIGFIALTLANSELFTEDFLVPIAAVAAKRGTVWSLLRLWAGTLVTNLLGGWVIMGLVILGKPELGRTAVEVAQVYPSLGIGAHSFALALLGGASITLMTWMERSTVSIPGKLAAAASVAFLLAAASLNHVIVVSLEMFAALHAGAPFGYADWLRVLAWATLGNVVGGVALVTMLRLVQVGRDTLEEERGQAD